MRRIGEGRRIKMDAVPLDTFPVEWRERIREQVAQDTPPPKWLTIADGLAQIPSRAWFEWHWARGRYPMGGDNRPSLPPKVRQQIIDRDGYLCGLCGGAVEPDDVHIDHIVPWSRGGSDGAENLQVSHSLCNIRKGAKV